RDVPRAERPSLARPRYAGRQPSNGPPKSGYRLPCAGFQSLLGVLCRVAERMFEPGELAGAHLGCILCYGLVRSFSHLGITLDELGTEIHEKAENIIHNEHLAVTIRT